MKKKFGVKERYYKNSNHFHVENETDISSRKKFQIIDFTPSYQPEEKIKPDFDISVYSDQSFVSCNTYELYITPKAKKNIFNHIGWDMETPQNRTEQGGILLGRVYRDNSKNLIYGIVEDAIAGESAIASGTYLEMDHNTWKEMIDKLDHLYAQSGFQIIGWYHTHPRQLNVFMSYTDRRTQSLLFPNDWQFAIVLNPNKCIFRVFHGKDSEACMGFIIKDVKNDNKEISKKISGYNMLALFLIFFLVFISKTYKSLSEKSVSKIFSVCPNKIIKLNDKKSSKCSAFNFTKHKIVYSNNKNADIIFDVRDDKKFFLSPDFKNTGFVLIDEPFDEVTAIPKDIVFSNKLELNKPQYDNLTILIKMRSDKYAKLSIKRFGNSGSDSFIQFKYCMN